MEPTHDELQMYITKQHAIAIIESQGFNVVIPKGTLICGVPSQMAIETECGRAFYKECWKPNFEAGLTVQTIKAAHVWNWLCDSLNSPWRMELQYKSGLISKQEYDLYLRAMEL
tara:strand:+ start:102 stop:443 length:342 start_codon:yes stop_codon:yes gene_type:complete